MDDSAGAPKRDPQIRQALRDLNDQIEELSKSASVLAQSMEPLLRPEPTTTCGGPTEAPDGQCELSVTIGNRAEAVRSVRNQITDLQARLEI